MNWAETWLWELGREAKAPAGLGSGRGAGLRAPGEQSQVSGRHVAAEGVNVLRGESVFWFGLAVLWMRLGKEGDDPG